MFLLQIIDQEINPYVDQWEAEGKFPAHKVFKILGNAGFLGVNKPVGKMSKIQRSAPLRGSHSQTSKSATFSCATKCSRNSQQ